MARALSYPITRPISRAVSGADLGGAQLSPLPSGQDYFYDASTKQLLVALDLSAVQQPLAAKVS